MKPLIVDNNKIPDLRAVWWKISSLIARANLSLSQSAQRKAELVLCSQLYRPIDFCKPESNVFVSGKC